MKVLEISAQSKEEAIQKAIKKYGVPIKVLHIISVDDSSSDMLEGATPLELRVKFQISFDYLVDLAREKTSQLLDLMGLTSEVRASLEGNLIKIKLAVPNPQVLIGTKGDVLDAIQHIVNRIVTRGERDLPIIVVDVQNYRERHLREIDSLAKKAALSVLKYKKKFVLPQMSPEDRKMIHNKIKEFNGVKSFSQGREGSRRVIVDLITSAEDSDKTFIPKPQVENNTTPEKQ